MDKLYDVTIKVKARLKAHGTSKKDALLSIAQDLHEIRESISEYAEVLDLQIKRMEVDADA